MNSLIGFASITEQIVKVKQILAFFGQGPELAWFALAAIPLVDLPTDG
jgi:hypothetical protein